MVTVNGDLWPVNHEANQRHMRAFDAIVLKNADHFLMMSQPVPKDTKAVQVAMDSRPL